MSDSTPPNPSHALFGKVAEAVPGVAAAVLVAVVLTIVIVRTCMHRRNDLALAAAAASDADDEGEPPEMYEVRIRRDMILGGPDAAGWDKILPLACSSQRSVSQKIPHELPPPSLVSQRWSRLRWPQIGWPRRLRSQSLLPNVVPMRPVSPTRPPSPAPRSSHSIERNRSAVSSKPSLALQFSPGPVRVTVLVSMPSPESKRRYGQEGAELGLPYVEFGVTEVSADGLTAVPEAPIRPSYRVY